MKSGFYITTSNDQLSSWTDSKLQSTSQSQACTKKRSWSPAVWSYSFLNPSETITSESSILSKSMIGTENRKACRQHWSTERAQFFSTTTPDHTSRNNFSKVEQIRLWRFPSSIISSITWPLTNRLPLLQESWQLFSGKMLPLPTKNSSNPEAWTFMLQEWEVLFLVGKNVLIVMVPILINKDVFGPSYNDLKFMVWNCNYFYINLIENPKDAIRKLLEIINEFSKVSGYKINTQKSLAFLYTNNERSEREIKKTIPFTIGIKYLGINLKRQKTCTQKTKTWREKSKTIQIDINIVKMTILPKAIYRFNAIHIKLLLSSSR